MKIAEFDDSGKRIDDLSTEKIVREDEEWRQLLPRNAYDVARRKGTEMAFSGAYWKTKEAESTDAHAAAVRYSVLKPSSIQVPVGQASPLRSPKKMCRRNGTAASACYE